MRDPLVALSILNILIVITTVCGAPLSALQSDANSDTAAKTGPLAPLIAAAPAKIVNGSAQQPIIAAANPTAAKGAAAVLPTAGNSSSPAPGQQAAKALSMKPITMQNIPNKALTQPQHAEAPPQRGASAGAEQKKGSPLQQPPKATLKHSGNAIDEDAFLSEDSSSGWFGSGDAVAEQEQKQKQQWISGPSHTEPAEKEAAFPPLPSNNQAANQQTHVGNQQHQPTDAGSSQPADRMTQTPPLPPNPSNPVGRQLPSSSPVTRQPSADSREQQHPSAQKEEAKPAQQQEQEEDAFSEAWFAGDTTDDEAEQGTTDEAADTAGQGSTEQEGQDKEGTDAQQADRAAALPLTAPLPGDYQPPSKRNSRWHQPGHEHYPPHSHDDYPPSHGPYRGEGKDHPGPHYDSHSEHYAQDYDRRSGPHQQQPYGEGPSVDLGGKKYPAGEPYTPPAPYAKEGADPSHTSKEYSHPHDEEDTYQKNDKYDKPLEYYKAGYGEPKPDDGDIPGTEYEEPPAPQPYTPEGQPPSDSYSTDKAEQPTYEQPKQETREETKKEDRKVVEETMEQLMSKYKALQQEKLYQSIKEEYDSMKSMYKDLMKTLDDLKAPKKDTPVEEVQDAGKNEAIQKDSTNNSQEESKEGPVDDEEKSFFGREGPVDSEDKPFFGGNRFTFAEEAVRDSPGKKQPPRVHYEDAPREQSDHAPQKPDYAPSETSPPAAYPPGGSVAYPVEEPAPELHVEETLREGAAMCDADLKPLHNKKVYGNVCLKEVKRDLTDGTTRMPQHIESILQCCKIEGSSMSTLGWSVRPSPQARVQGLSSLFSRLKNPQGSRKGKTPQAPKKKNEAERKKKGKKEPQPAEEPYDEGQFEDDSYSSGEETYTGYDHHGPAGRCSITIHYFDRTAATHVGTDGLCLGVAIANCEFYSLCGATHMGHLPLNISSMGVVKAKPAKIRTVKPYGDKDDPTGYVAGNALVAYIPIPLTPYSDSPYDGGDELQGLIKAKLAWFNDQAVFPDYGYNGAGIPAPHYAISKEHLKRLKQLPEVEPGTLNLLLKKNERQQY